MNDRAKAAPSITASSTRAELMDEIEVLRANALTVAMRVEWLVAQVVSSVDADDKLDPLLSGIRRHLDAWCAENGTERAAGAAVLIAAVVEDLGVENGHLDEFVGMFDQGEPGGRGHHGRLP